MKTVECDLKLTYHIDVGTKHYGPVTSTLKRIDIILPDDQAHKKSPTKVGEDL